MLGPLRILRFVWFPTRPSRIELMPIAIDKWWLRPHFAALTFFGHVIVAKEESARQLEKSYNRLRNHEQIHLRQAQACHDSWWLYYLYYLWYWLKGLYWARHIPHGAYILNPFEIEAYLNDHDLSYPEKCRESGAVQWRHYASLSFIDRCLLILPRMNEERQETAPSAEH